MVTYSIPITATNSVYFPAAYIEGGGGILKGGGTDRFRTYEIHRPLVASYGMPINITFREQNGTRQLHGSLRQVSTYATGPTGFR